MSDKIAGHSQSPKPTALHGTTTAAPPLHAAERNIKPPPKTSTLMQDNVRFGENENQDHDDVELGLRTRKKA